MTAGAPAMAVVTCLGPYTEHFLPVLGDRLGERAVIVGQRSDVPEGMEAVVLTVPVDTPALRAAADGTGWIHVLATGMDGFPMELVAGRTVTCSRGSAAVPIAEYVLAAMLTFEKRMPECFVTEPPTGGGWQTPDVGTLEGRTLAVIGLGSIGTEVAVRASAFGMRVVAVRRRHLPSPVPGVVLVDTLEAALADADHVVLSVPSTPQTAGLLDAAAFAAMKPGVHVVNVARGAVIDQDALLAALEGRRVARATLDVTEPEPLPAGHPLYHHPAVRISPHVSWAGPVTSTRVMGVFVDNVARRLAGEPLLGVVDAEAGY